MKEQETKAKRWRSPSRERFTEQDGRALIDAVAASGLSGQAFAATHGIQVQRIWYWRKRLGVAGSAPRRTEVVVPSSFIPARVMPRRDSPAGPDDCAQTLEVMLRSGVSVRVTGTWSAGSICMWLSALKELRC